MAEETRLACFQILDIECLLGACRDRYIVFLGLRSHDEQTDDGISPSSLASHVDQGSLGTGYSDIPAVTGISEYQAGHAT